VPGFYYEENIPEICRQTCEELWEGAIKRGISDHEEYPDLILEEAECIHPATDYGSSSLQAMSLGSAVRYFSITEHCMYCDQEVAEDSFRFECPRP
jgi:hypothetical protein